jgi:hypothetical protein
VRFFRLVYCMSGVQEGSIRVCHRWACISAIDGNRSWKGLLLTLNFN